jgi:hypothetical protein
MFRSAVNLNRGHELVCEWSEFLINSINGSKASFTNRKIHQLHNFFRLYFERRASKAICTICRCKKFLKSRKIPRISPSARQAREKEFNLKEKMRQCLMWNGKILSTKNTPEEQIGFESRWKMWKISLAIDCRNGKVENFPLFLFELINWDGKFGLMILASSHRNIGQEARR